MLPPVSAELALADPRVTCFHLYSTQRQVFKEPGQRLGNEVLVLRARRAGLIEASGAGHPLGDDRCLRAVDVDTEVDRDTICVDSVQLRMFFQVTFQIVGRVPFVIDAAVRIQADARQQSDIFLCRDIAKAPGGIEATMTVSQQTPDDDRVNVVSSAPAKQCGVVLYECVGRPSILVARSMRMCTGSI